MKLIQYLIGKGTHCTHTLFFIYIYFKSQLNLSK
nr:MAG TPA: hypothetical protein [Caudoviricetes sp.]